MNNPDLSEHQSARAATGRSGSSAISFGKLVAVLLVMNGAIAGILWLRRPADFVSLKGHQKGVNDVAFHRDGTLAATASDDGTIRLWDSSGREHSRITGNASRVTTVAFSPLGDNLASATGNGMIRIWDIASGIEVLPIEAHERSIEGMTYDAVADRIFTVSWDSTASAYDPDSGRLLNHTSLPAVAECCVLPADEQRLLVGCVDGVVREWNLAANSVRDLLIGHRQGIKSIRIAPDLDTVATCSQDRTIRLWSLSQETVVAEFSCSAVPLDSVFTADGGSLIVGTIRGRLIRYDLAAGSRVCEIKTPLSCIRSLERTDGGQLAAGGYRAMGLLFEVDRVTAK